MIKNRLSLLILFFLTVFYNTAPYDTIRALKPVHSALCNLFLPLTMLPTDKHREQALFFVKKSWKQCKHSFSVQSLLQPLLELTTLPADCTSAFPNIIKTGFAHALPEDQHAFLCALNRHHDHSIRNYITRLRTFYIYMVYNAALIEELSGVTVSPQIMHPTEFQLPASKLYITEQEIIHEEGPIDYLIIGSGPSGSLIAHELARLKKDCRIVVVEAGPFVKPHSIITESASELMESNNQRTTTTGGIVIRNGCVVGGGTTVNLDLAFSPLMPCITKNLHHWIKNQWIDKQLFKQAYEYDWRHLENTYAWVKEKVQTRLVTPHEINENNKLLQNAAPDTVHTYSLNQKKWTGNPHEILKISAVDAFLLPALQGGNDFQGSMSLLSDAKVTRILFDNQPNKKAIGVELVLYQQLNKEYIIQNNNHFNQKPGTLLKIHAAHVIISAGTLGTAELLLRSNVKNKNIGTGIVIHPSVGIFARFKKEINVMQGLSAAVFAHAHDLNDGYFFEAMAADPRFVAAVHPGSGEQILDTITNFKHLGGFGIMLIDSVHEQNRICINPLTNAVEIHYKLQEQDKVRLRKALKEGIRMLFDQGATQVFFPTCEAILSDKYIFLPITDKSQIDQAVDAWQGIENQTFISSAHMQASAKMGNDPAQSVVSTHFKVWDTTHGKEIPNLYVMDSSIFPTSIGANPMQSIYTFAKLFVDKLMHEENASPI